MALRNGYIKIEDIGAGQYCVVGRGDNSVNIRLDQGVVSVAEAFGMKLRHKNGCDDRRGTDGTTKCDGCGQTADAFFGQAMRFIERRADDGRSAVDPGYFSSEE